MQSALQSDSKSVILKNCLFCLLYLSLFYIFFISIPGIEYLIDSETKLNIFSLISFLDSILQIFSRIKYLNYYYYKKYYNHQYYL